MYFDMAINFIAIWQPTLSWHLHAQVRSSPPSYVATRTTHLVRQRSGMTLRVIHEVGDEDE